MRLRKSGGIGAHIMRMPRLLPLEHAEYDHKEQWDVKEVDECSGEHPARYSGANGIHGTCTRAGGDGQRQNPEEESQ